MAKEVKLKEPKAIDCSNCKFLCSLNFTEDLRIEICKSFWQLGDYRRQKDFILMNCVSSSPKRRRPSRDPSENPKIRTNSKSFFLLNKRVCQSFFLKTLSISNGPLIKAFQHKNIYTNFFDGEDKRGRHTPSNKLSRDIVDSIVNLLEQHTAAGPKSKKRIINNPEIRSLRHLFSMYKESHQELAPSYTSFKRIFNEHNFSFPPDHQQRARPQLKALSETKPEIKHDQMQVDNPLFFEDEEYIEEHIIECDEALSKQESQEPKVIVAQVPDSSKFFANPSQVYEIQIIEIPLQSIIKPS